MTAMKSKMCIRDSVEADADVRLQLHAVNDGAQLLEAAADLAALAGHGLEQDGRGHAGKRTSLSSAAIFSMPASMPCPTWLPG